MIILRKIHVKIKSFTQPQKETKHIHASSADLLITVVELEISIDANARSILRKKLSFTMSQNSEETPVPEKRPVTNCG